VPGHPVGSVLLAEIFPGQEQSSGDAILDGWAPPENTHRWTVGRESRCRLPPVGPGADVVLVLDIKPYVDFACPHQTVMLAVDGRLLATVQLAEQRVLGYRLPAGLAENASLILSFCHLNSRLPRAPAGLDHNGLPLGLMVISLRLYRLTQPPGVPKTLAALRGSIADDKLSEAAQQMTGMSPAELSAQFECLGHNCVQRGLGAEPLGLLRFAGVVTHRLADGLCCGFAGIGGPATTHIFVRDDPGPQFKVHEEIYYLWYSAGRTPDETTAQAVHAEQCRRFLFLQRKFTEDLQLGEKIFAVSRSEPMTEPEALALFCPLNLHARNTLLWTLAGGPERAGQVEQNMPGFLLGHLGDVDPVTLYATHDAWLKVMINAYRLKKDSGSSLKKRTKKLLRQ
jgi:hypothetical protein